MASKTLCDRLPAWVFWPLFVVILLSSVGSAVGLYLLNSSPEPVNRHEPL